MDFKTAKKYLKPENNIRVGITKKTHGYKGRILLDNFINLENIDFVFLEIDGFLVPYIIDFQNSEYHLKPHIIKFKNIDTIEQAQKLVKKQVFLPIEIINQIEVEIEDNRFAEGFQIWKNNEFLGIVKTFFNYEKNPLFELDTGKIIPLESIENLNYNINERKLFITLKKGAIV